MTNSTSEELTSPSTDIAPPLTLVEAPLPEHHVNSVDATAHQPLVARVTERKQELETLLAALDSTDTHAKQDIEAALSAVEPLLSGDLANVAAVVMVDLNRWLERSKHLGERNAIAPVIAPIDAPIDALVIAPVEALADAPSA